MLSFHRTPYRCRGCRRRFYHYEPKVTQLKHDHTDDHSQSVRADSKAG